jgi:opacity protein-like surface antigen
MMKISVGFFALIGIGSTAIAAAGPLDNPAGFYVGAGVGASNIGSDGYGYDGNYAYNHDETAWKLIAGVRPIAPVGAELEYIDFGRADDSPNYGYNGYQFNELSTASKATALFAVGYLPLPIPFLDIYGKAGVARLQQDSTTYYDACGQTGCVGTEAYRNDDWSTDFAYGVGVQTKWLGLAVRAEYERIDASGRDPDALTVSATWTF